ncbi:MEOX1 protein, partial [Agelaius phoeniceus]|nr:MEOX1 protein [Agelaius phoeniceus]
MDPSSSSCMRSPQPPPLLWGCVRSSHPELSSAPGLSHYPAAPFSFQQKADFAAYSDFSPSCLVPAAHSFPQEQHPSFQHPEWHLAAPEATRGANPGLALASGESEGSSTSLVSVAVDEDDEAPANPTSDSEKKPSRRKKESSVKLCSPFLLEFHKSPLYTHVLHTAQAEATSNYFLFITQVKVWFQNRRMKWKRVKGGQAVPPHDHDTEDVDSAASPSSE